MSSAMAVVAVMSVQPTSESVGARHSSGISAVAADATRTAERARTLVLASRMGVS